jgi:hypothetical protein
MSTGSKYEKGLGALGRKTKTGNQELANENLTAVRLRPWSRYESAQEKN